MTTVIQNGKKERIKTVKLFKYKLMDIFMTDFHILRLKVWHKQNINIVYYILTKYIRLNKI